MMRTVFVAALVAALVGPSSVALADLLGVTLSYEPPPAGHAGQGALVMPGGELRGLVDVQGGYPLPDHPHSVNLNLGAGSNRGPHPFRGNVVVNPDIGERFIVEDGRLHRSQVNSQKGIHFYKWPQVWVHGRWRRVAIMGRARSTR